jgi:hypothetical protein
MPPHWEALTGPLSCNYIMHGDVCKCSLLQLLRMQAFNMPASCSVAQCTPASLPRISPTPASTSTRCSTLQAQHWHHHQTERMFESPSCGTPILVILFIQLCCTWAPWNAATAGHSLPSTSTAPRIQPLPPPPEASALLLLLLLARPARCALQLLTMLASTAAPWGLRVASSSSHTCKRKSARVQHLQCSSLCALCNVGQQCLGVWGWRADPETTARCIWVCRQSRYEY